MSLRTRIAKVEQLQAANAKITAEIERQLERLRGRPDGQRIIDQVMAEFGVTSRTSETNRGTKEGSQ
jgi:hypothetical protein